MTKKPEPPRPAGLTPTQQRAYNELDSAGQRDFNQNRAMGSTVAAAFEDAARRAKARDEDMKAADAAAERVDRQSFDKIKPVPVAICQAKLFDKAHAEAMVAAKVSGDWEGVEPGKLPIDRWIDDRLGELAGEQARPILKKEFRAAAAGELYSHVRFHIWLAVEGADAAARHELELHRIDRARDSNVKLLGKVATMLARARKLANDADLLEEPRLSARPDDDAINRNRQETNRWRRCFDGAGEAALELRARLRAPRKPLERTDRNPWASAFADRLGYLWFELTGNETAARPTGFDVFLSAAYASIGGEGEKWNWGDYVKQARLAATARPEWDHYGRYVDDWWPPGTQFEKMDGWKARRARRFEASADVAAWVAEMKAKVEDVPPSRVTEELRYWAAFLFSNLSFDCFDDPEARERLENALRAARSAPGP